MNRRSAIALALAAPALLRAPRALAQDYPHRPIRMIVPFAAGGTADVIARYYGNALGAALGQPVVVDNRVGANGTIGLAAGLRAPPDGYTLIQVSNTNTVAAVHMIRNLPFDPLRDMASIGSIYQIPAVVLASNSFPATNFAECLALVRANPGRYSYAYSHATGAVTGRSVALVADLDMEVISYRSGPQMMNDLVGGQIPLVFTDVALALPFLEAHSIKVFAVSSSERSDVLPGIPTLRESLPRPVEFVGWGGFVAPAATPRPIIERLNAELNRSVATPESDTFLRSIGAERMAGTPEGFDAFIHQQAPLWTDALRAAQIEPE